jgi:hypothetical protein
MHSVTLIDEENDVIALARKLDCIDELCSLEDYHPDYGKVVPYWKPRWFALALFKELKSNNT